MMPNPELLAGLVNETTGDILEDETSGENGNKTALTVRWAESFPMNTLTSLNFPQQRGKCGLYTRAWKAKLSFYKQRTSSNQES